MILELVGLPGGGKSFLAPRIAANNGLQIVRVGRLGQRHVYRALFVLSHPRLYRALRRLCGEQAGDNDVVNRMNVRRLGSAVAKTHKARLLGDGLIDEGLFQFLLSVYETPPSVSELAAIIERIPEAGLRILFVQADGAIRDRRMQERNKIPRAELGASYVQRWLRAQENTLASLHAACCLRFTCADLHNSAMRADVASQPGVPLEIDGLSSPDWAFPRENAAGRPEQGLAARWTKVWHPAPLPVTTTLQIRAALPRGEGRLSRLFWRKLLRVAASVPFARDVAAMYYSMLDPQTPLRAKCVFAAALGYFAMPFDLIPDFVAGVGFVDDAAVLSAGLWFMSRYIGKEHRERAIASLGAFA